MNPATDTDPRPPVEPDIRPLVGRSRSGLPAWVGLVLILLAGVGLFAMLDTRRRATSAPPVRLRDTSAATDVPIPPLVIPPAPVAAPVATPLPAPVPAAPRPLPPQPRIVYMPPPPVRQQPEFLPPPPAAPPPAAAGAAPGSALVVDLTTADTGPAPTAGAPAGGGATPTAVSPAAGARATVLRQRATVVPQGTLIPAVLETALDSTRPGPARALVTADVHGFDGSRVLIPRGSGLVGEYRADLRAGQNRALIIWSRLTRPDGVIVALASPAADQIGRAGVRGSVDSHFFARFGSAILQSSLNVGVALASRIGSGDSIAVLGLPTALGTTGDALDTPAVQPTLRVRQGTATAVFVARDLDFTGVERAR